MGGAKSVNLASCRCSRASAIFRSIRPLNLPARGTERGEHVSGAIRARGHRIARVARKRLETEDFNVERSLYREPVHTYTSPESKVVGIQPENRPSVRTLSDKVFPFAGRGKKFNKTVTSLGRREANGFRYYPSANLAICFLTQLFQAKLTHACARARAQSN